MIKAAVFDLDDTLFDDYTCIEAGLIAVFARYSCSKIPRINHLMTLYKAVIDQLLPEFQCGHISQHQFRTLRFDILFESLGIVGRPGSAAFSEYRAAYLQARTSIAGAKDLLETLQNRCIKVGILTNHLRSEQLQKLEICGLTPWIQVLITPEDGAHKPHPKAFETVLAALNVNPAETVMIGDSWENDILGARAVGMQAVWFNRWGQASPLESVPVLHSFQPVEAALKVILL